MPVEACFYENFFSEMPVQIPFICWKFRHSWVAGEQGRVLIFESKSWFHLLKGYLRCKTIIFKICHLKHRLRIFLFRRKIRFSLARCQLELARQIFAKVDLVPIDNNSKKIKGAKKYKPYKIPRKLLVTLLLFT